MSKQLLGWLCGALLALGATTSSAGDTPSFDPMLAEMGAERFAEYCSSCHGRKARGDGPVRFALTTPPADLTRIAARRGGKFPDGEIGRMIDGRFDITAHGTREMPVWGERFSSSIPEGEIAEGITRGYIATLIEFLKSVQRD